VDITEELTHISLCAGYGGIDLGLKRVLPNLRTVAFSEIEAYAVANLVSKMEAGLLDAAPIWTNLKTFPWKSFRGKVDLLSGGFPCQPFSAAGRRKGDEDPRHLFPYIKQGIQLLRPAIVFLENVEGIISSKLGEGWTDTEGTPVLLHVLRELERVDYKATAGIFSASEIGAPHQRKRVFIMAYSNNLKRAAGSIDLVHQIGRSMEGTRKAISKEWSTRSNAIISNRDVWPSRRGEDQKEWEPKRTIKSSLGRGVDGSSNWMDYGDLCESVCNQTDELRLLGNGVVPSTAERAFRVLWRKLNE
jgi:DNA (cytosine-5)-methyltransferase 1